MNNPLPTRILAGLTLAATFATLTGAGSAAPVPLARTAQPLFRQAPVEPNRPIPMPMAQARPGCYVNLQNGWKPVACATDDYVRAHYPHPELQFSILSTPRAGEPERGSTLPLVFGRIDMLFHSVGTSTDYTYGPNAFSLQENTNLFSGSNKKLDGVQFVDQSHPGQPDGLCIWNVDVTDQVYHPTCLNVPKLRAGGFVAGDKPEILGFVLPGGLLQIIGILPWSIGLWTIIVPDEYGLTGRWSEVSGAPLGFGDGSHLHFSHADESTRVYAGTCYDDYDASEDTCSNRVVFNSSAVASDAGNTEETNNLIPVIGEPPFVFPGLSEDNPNLMYMDYYTSTSGKCPSGTHPPLCTN